MSETDEDELYCTHENKRKVYFKNLEQLEKKTK